MKESVHTGNLMAQSQLSIISDSSCSRSSSPMAGSMSSSRWSSVNWLISSSNSSTVDELEPSGLEVGAARDDATLYLRLLDWVGVLGTGLKCTGERILNVLPNTACSSIMQTVCTNSFKTVHMRQHSSVFWHSSSATLSLYRLHYLVGTGQGSLTATPLEASLVSGPRSGWVEEVAGTADIPWTFWFDGCKGGPMTGCQLQLQTELRFNIRMSFTAQHCL